MPETIYGFRYQWFHCIAYQIYITLNAQLTRHLITQYELVCCKYHERCQNKQTNKNLKSKHNTLIPTTVVAKITLTVVTDCWLSSIGLNKMLLIMQYMYVLQNDYWLNIHKRYFVYWKRFRFIHNLWKSGYIARRIPEHCLPITLHFWP